MKDRPQLRVLFFDVFGTCVAQLPPLADELCKTAKDALHLKGLSAEVRMKASLMSYNDWFEIAREWNRDVDVWTKSFRERTGNVDWRAVDTYRFESLNILLCHRGLLIPHEEPDAADLRVKEDSLFDEAQLKQLGYVWHRLPPWPDTCRGLELLNTKFTTATLSNTYNELIQGLVAHSQIPFQYSFSSDLFDSYKPNPKVYLGAAEKLGVKPEECGLVAAHLSDLKGAKACGFYAIYVERPEEEKSPELREEGIPDMVIREGEDGLVTVANKLGIEG